VLTKSFMLRGLGSRKPANGARSCSVASWMARSENLTATSPISSILVTGSEMPAAPFAAWTRSRSLLRDIVPICLGTSFHVQPDLPWGW